MKRKINFSDLIALRLKLLVNQLTLNELAELISGVLNEAEIETLQDLTMVITDAHEDRLMELEKNLEELRKVRDEIMKDHPDMIDEEES